MSEVEIPEPVGKFIIDNATGVTGNDGTYYHYSVVCTLLKKYVGKYKDLHDLAKGRLNKAHEYTDKLEARVKELEDSRKKDCTEFFYWWWNQGGTNTESGYDEWLTTK